jgi:hypothetical protein
MSIKIGTITYSPSTKGWTSFWSYQPDWMVGMNNSFYTFKDGNIYQHDVNQTRNSFYGYQYSSSITSVFNQDVLAVKMYKTIALDSTTPWDTEITTDLNTGVISSSFYQEKEGNYYAYIRRANDGSIDLKALSTQGVGSLLSYSTLVFNFNFDLGTSISQGDTIYINRNGVSQAQGIIASHTNRTITVTAKTGAFTPVLGDYIFIAKNSQAESYGARGYYMEVKLTNTSTTLVDIFGVSSSTFKSYM